MFECTKLYQTIAKFQSQITFLGHKKLDTLHTTDDLFGLFSAECVAF